MSYIIICCKKDLSRIGYSHAGVVDQDVESRLLFHKSLRPILDAVKTLLVHHERMKVECLFTRCLHPFNGRVEPLRGATGDVYSSAMESKL